MPTWLIIVIIVAGVVALGLGALVFFGRRAEKKTKENEAALQKGAQPMSFYIIDKKKDISFLLFLIFFNIFTHLICI